MTRIADLLDKGKTYSFEFFPPKNDAEQATLVTTLRELEPLVKDRQDVDVARLESEGCVFHVRARRKRTFIAGCRGPRT